MSKVNFADEERQEALGSHLSTLTTLRRGLTIHLDGKTVEAINSVRDKFKSNLIPEPSIGAVARHLITQGLDSIQQEGKS